ncbi:hypothetical protein ACTXT7_002288 [Hymenolepis weldensis]
MNDINGLLKVNIGRKVGEIAATAKNSSVMCEIVNLIVTPGSLRINIVCPQVAYSYRLEKCTSDDTCRGDVSEPVLSTLSPPFPTTLLSNLSTHNYVLMRALIQLTNINSLSIHTQHTQRSSLVRHIFFHSLFSSILWYPFGCLYCGSSNTSWSNQLLPLTITETMSSA